MQGLQQAQRPDDGRIGKTDDLFTKAGFIEHGLVILFHGGIDFGANIEGVVDHGFFAGQAQPDGAAQVLHIQQLVTVIAITDIGKVFPILGPIVKDGKNTQAFGTDKRFGANDGHHHPFLAVFEAGLFGGYFGLAVGADTDHPVGFIEGMVVGDAVNGGGGDMHKTFNALFMGFVQQ